MRREAGRMSAWAAWGADGAVLKRARRYALGPTQYIGAYSDPSYERSTSHVVRTTEEER